MIFIQIHWCIAVSPQPDRRVAWAHFEEIVSVQMLESLRHGGGGGGGGRTKVSALKISRLSNLQIEKWTIH